MRPSRHRLTHLGVCALLLGACSSEQGAQNSFADDFEAGLSGWDVHGSSGVFVQDSGDPEHGSVLVLRPHGDVHALIRGTEAWAGVRLEGQVLFPEDVNNYLGIVYNLHRSGDRLDFGNIYIKCNGSYLQVNPHRDYNVARTLYPEYSVSLEGADAVRIGEWQPFVAEVVGNDLHFYFNDLTTPKVTFPYLELAGGAIGLQPRSVGGDVWVDDIVASEITQFSYRGPAVPSVDYDRTGLLTDWEVLGPLAETNDDAARDAEGSFPWRPFETDARGAVVTGSVVDSHGPRSVAYFRTVIESDAERDAVLHLSTIDDLAIWVNGRFHWFMDRDRPAWHDMARNPEHEGQRIPLQLRAGTNHLVIRVRGGVYATGGFFASVERGAAESASDGVAATITDSLSVAAFHTDPAPDLPTADVGIYLLDTDSPRYSARMDPEEVLRRFALAKGIFAGVGVHLNLRFVRFVRLTPEVLEIPANVMAGTPGGEVDGLYDKSRQQRSTLSPQAEAAFVAIIEADTLNDRTVYLVGMEDVLMAWYEQEGDGSWALRSDPTNALSFPSYTLEDRIPRRLRGVITVQNIFHSQKILAHEIGHKLINVSHEYRDIAPEHEVDAEGGLMVYGEGTEIAAGFEGRWHLERLLRSPYLYRMGADGVRVYNPDYAENGHYADPIYGDLVRR